MCVLGRPGHFAPKMTPKNSETGIFLQCNLRILDDRVLCPLLVTPIWRLLLGLVLSISRGRRQAAPFPGSIGGDCMISPRRAAPGPGWVAQI